VKTFTRRQSHDKTNCGEDEDARNLTPGQLFVFERVREASVTRNLAKTKQVMRDFLSQTNIRKVKCWSLYVQDEPR